MPDLEAVVEQLLERTAPPDEPLPGIEASPVFAILGLLWRAHGLLEGLLTLRRAGGEELGGEVISRSVFEHAVTGLWLLEQPADAGRIFVQAGNRELRVLAEADQRFASLLDDAKQRWADSAWAELPFEARMPTLPERLVGPLAADPRFYTWYRVLSGRVHPSAPTINQMLEHGDDGPVVAAVPGEWYSGGRLALPFAAMMFWVLAIRFQGTIPLFADTPGLAALGGALNEFMRGEVEA